MKIPVDDPGLSGRKSKDNKHRTANSRETPQGRPSKSKFIAYINKVPFEREIHVAESAYKDAKEFFESIMGGIRIGRTIDMNQCHTCVDNIVDSILRNNDALVFLTKIREKDSYTAEHCLSVCVLSALFARHLGHNEGEIREIALCGLLHDVGKAKVPLEILNKEGSLQEEELQIMKNHTVYGRDLLMSTNGVDRIAVEVAYSHHERLDGNGYPRGLHSDQIPYYSKVIAIADSYDAITSNRCYKSAKASMDALDILHRARGTQFDEDLALEFIKCIGAYPPGSVVELSSGEVGIVIASNLQHKLKPRILLVRDKNKKQTRERVVNLATLSNPDIYRIVKELPNGSYGIDIIEYLQK